MFAIDHAATALLLKRRYPSVPLAPLLISVQAMELAWVGLNYLGIERTSTDGAVDTVANIHLAHMPYSHSVAIPLAAAALVWLVMEKGFGRIALGRAVGLGILSHLVLDLLTHDHDILLWPGRASPALGLGLYGSAPMAAFALELAYGVVCWRLYRGSKGLLALIVVANLANLSLFSSAIPGPEQLLAGRPLLVVTFVLVQIIVTLVLVGVLAATATTPPAPSERPEQAPVGSRVGIIMTENIRRDAASKFAVPTADQLAAARDIVARFAERWDRPRAEDLRDLMHPDTQNLIPPMSKPADREGVIEHFRQVLQQMPDLRIVVERWAPTGDAVMVEWRAYATVVGQSMSWTGVDRFCLRGNRMYEACVYWDTRGLAERMAAVVLEATARREGRLLEQA